MCACARVFCVTERIGEKEGHYFEYYYHHLTLITQRGERMESAEMRKEGGRDKGSDKKREKMKELGHISPTVTVVIPFNGFTCN